MWLQILSVLLSSNSWYSTLICDFFILSDFYSRKRRRTYSSSDEDVFINSSKRYRVLLFRRFKFTWNIIEYATECHHFAEMLVSNLANRDQSNDFYA